jgi:hypothetical protein
MKWSLSCRTLWPSQTHASLSRFRCSTLQETWQNKSSLSNTYLVRFSDSTCGLMMNVCYTCQQHLTWQQSHNFQNFCLCWTHTCPTSPLETLSVHPLRGANGECSLSDMSPVNINSTIIIYVVISLNQKSCLVKCVCGHLAVNSSSVTTESFPVM